MRAQPCAAFDVQVSPAKITEAHFASELKTLRAIGASVMRRDAFVRTLMQRFGGRNKNTQGPPPKPSPAPGPRMSHGGVRLR